MIFRMELTQNDLIDILNIKYLRPKTIGYNFPPEIYEFIHIIPILKSSLPYELKVNITIDDIRLRSNLSTNKTFRFTKNSFFTHF